MSHGNSFKIYVYIKMPRTYTNRKRSSRRPSARKSYRPRRRFIGKKVNTLMTKRFVVKTTIIGDDVANFGSSTHNFKLSDLPNVGEFTSLFDQYMISGIQYRWIIRREPGFVSTAANKGFSPRLGWVHDHDSDQVVSAFSDIQQYPRYQEVNFTDSKMATRWYYLKPASCSSVYNGVYNGFSAQWRTYLDSAYPAVPHYGIRAYFEGLYLGNILQLECKYILKLKSVI